MVKVERQRWDRKESGREMGSLQPPGSVSRVRQEQQGKPEVGVPANRESLGHSEHSVGPELEPIGKDNNRCLRGLPIPP